MKVRIVGTTTLIADLEKIIIKASKINQVVEKNTAEMQRTAKSVAPVDTGLLKRSISKTVTGSTGKVKSEVDYAIYQEYGTRFQPGTPHIRPAFNKQKDIFVEDLENLIKK